MKKTLLLFASAALLLVGCAKEQIAENNVGGEGLQTVSFTVGVESAATKAVADEDGKAANINHWIMQVLDSDGEVYNYQEDDGEVGAKTHTFNVPLVKGQTYQVLFWADTKNKYVVTDLRTVTRATDVATTANSDDLDAFSAVVNDFTTTTATQQNITLKRPFAQLNVVFTDLKKLYDTMGSGAEYAKFKPENFVAKAKVPTTFNVLTQAAGAPAETALEMTAAECYNPSGLEDQDNYTTHGEKATLYMDYILASAASKDVVDIDFSFVSKGVTIAHNFAAVPFQRNYRTNILGDLMSANAKWTVTVDPNWDSLNDGSKDYNVNYYEPSSITDAQNYIANNDDQKAKTVDLSKYTVTTGDFDPNAEDKTIKFELKTTSPADMVNFTLPAIPADVISAGCTGWKITHETGYPTDNVNVTAPEGTIVTIDAPRSHVTLNGSVYNQVTATTGPSTLVVPAGVTIDNLIVKKGAVEIHGIVTNLTVDPAPIADTDPVQYEKVVFRACEGLSASVFEKIYNESEHINYIDPMYAYKQVDGKYNIYKLPVVAMIGTVEYPSLAAALAAVQANEAIEVVAESVELPSILKADITLKGNGATKVTKFGGLTGKNVTLDGFEFTVQINPNAENFAIKNSKFTGNNGLRYAYAKGNVLIENCVFDTQTYGIHFDGTQPGKATVKGCQIVGFNTFNPELNFVDCNFVDSDKNQYYVAQAWSNVSFTNCTFSEKWCAVTDYQTIGIASGNGVATLNGCTTAIGTVVDACMNSAMTGVVAIDATGNATDGFTAGTFITGDAANIKVAQGYMAKAVEGKDNVWTVAVKPAAKVGDVEYATLEAALNAARTAMGGTITLLSDVVLTKNISWNGKDGFWTGADDSKRQHGDGTVTDCSNKYIFDLNGYHVTSQEGKNCKIEVRGCEFNIKDSKGGGYISNPNGFAFYLGSEREPHYDNCGVLNIYGGEFKGKNDNPCSAFAHTYSIGTDGTTNDGYVNAKIINIHGGEFEGLSCDEVKVNIYGGHFTSYIYKGSRNTVNVHKDGSENDAIFVYGGKFDVNGVKQCKEGSFDIIDISSDYFHIYAGDFNFNPAAYVMEGSKVEKVGDRWIVTQNN